MNFRRIKFLLLVLLLPATSFSFDQNHSRWNDTLKQYLAPDGRVHYQKLKNDLGQTRTHPLALYLDELKMVTENEYASWKREYQMAFLINAYNALTIRLILDHYPVSSIKKIGGLFSSPWKMEFFSLLGGRIKNLDTIEHEYLRKQFAEPFVHAAVNCASLSCPRLQTEAFVGTRLSAQLESAFRGFLSDDFRNRYDAKSGTLFLSEIFKWFGDDFKPRFGSFLKAIETYGPPAARESISKGAKIEWIKYDWSLNDADTHANGS